MWMLKPSLLCRQHLLGEHNELHKLAGCLRLGRSVAGYVENGLVDLSRIEERHEELVVEMRVRNYNHKSPLKLGRAVCGGKVDIERNWKDLWNRCLTCRENIRAHMLKLLEGVSSGNQENKNL
jgi:hypothetical protein